MSTRDSMREATAPSPRPSTTSSRSASRTSHSGPAKAPLLPVAVAWEDGISASRPLSTPAALREFLADLDGVGEGRGREGEGGVEGVALYAAEGRSGKPRLVLRGPAPAFVRVLLDDASLGIDPDFVAAHAARRRYRPRRGVVSGQEAAQWTYFELEGGGGGSGSEARVVRHGGGAAAHGRLGRAAARWSVSDGEDLVAVEYRASAWVAGKVDVLFLDKPVQEEDSEGLLREATRRRRRRSRSRRRSVMASDNRQTKEMENTGGESAATADEAVQSLEDALQETLSAPADARRGRTLVDVLEATAYEKWLDFFEVLTPRHAALFVDGTLLEWRALQALEGNLGMAQGLLAQRRRGNAPSTEPPPDWSFLIQRLRDRTALLVAHGPPARTRTLHNDNFIDLPPRPRQRPRAPPPGPVTSSGDENHRALDRVTYLGGILLPISIVSSVLSMNEDFEPGQPLFWVFWAAAVPLTLVTLVVIYADKLAGAEVWVQVGGSLGAGPSSAGDMVSMAEAREHQGRHRQHAEAGGPPEHEKWDGWGQANERARGHHRPTAVQPHAMPYASQDVVIDLGDAVAQVPPIVLQPRTSNQLDDNDDGEGEDEEEGYDEENVNRHSYSVHPDQHYQQAAQPSVSSDDHDMGPDTYISRPMDGTRPQAWRKKQLGWGGAAMCILRMQKPLRVEDGLPVAPAARRDVERRLTQARRRASVEGRRSLSY